jgi:hypothetical protein
MTGTPGKGQGYKGNDQDTREITDTPGRGKKKHQGDDRDTSEWSGTPSR